MAEVKTDPELSRRLGAAIKQALGQRQQKEVAAAIGVDGGRLSRWISGEVRPSLEQIRALEQACDVGDGALLYAAGYLAPPKTVLEATAVDLELSEAGRHFVVGAYGVARSLPGED